MLRARVPHIFVAFAARLGFKHPDTRAFVELLGPCFKTGRLSPFCQHQEEVSGSTSVSNRKGITLH